MIFNFILFVTSSLSKWFRVILNESKVIIDIMYLCRLKHMMVFACNFIHILFSLMLDISLGHVGLYQQQIFYCKYFYPNTRVHTSSKGQLLLPKKIGMKPSILAVSSLFENIDCHSFHNFSRYQSWLQLSIPIWFCTQ